MPPMIQMPNSEVLVTPKDGSGENYNRCPLQQQHYMLTHNIFLKLTALSKKWSKFGLIFTFILGTKSLQSRHTCKYGLLIWKCLIQVWKWVYSLILVIAILVKKNTFLISCFLPYSNLGTAFLD